MLSAQPRTIWALCIKGRLRLQVRILTCPSLLTRGYAGPPKSEPRRHGTVDILPLRCRRTPCRRQDPREWNSCIWNGFYNCIMARISRGTGWALLICHGRECYCTMKYLSPKSCRSIIEGWNASNRASEYLDIGVLIISLVSVTNYSWRTSPWKHRFRSPNKVELAPALRWGNLINLEGIFC